MNVVGQLNEDTKRLNNIVQLFSRLVKDPVE